MVGDDRELRELYRQGRGEGEKAPEFDELMARSKGRRGVGGHRWAPVMVAAAAAVVLAVSLGLGLGDGKEVEERALSGAVAMEGEEEVMEVEEVAGDEEWDELMEFADEVWEWEGETDYLLAEL